MGELRFTASVVMAIDTMSSVLRGKIFQRTRGREWSLDNLLTLVEVPVWCNFRFFHRIRPLPIRRTERVEATTEVTANWKLERSVEFYYHGQLVAVVELVGMKLDESCLGTGTDNASFWGVSKVGYFQYFDTSHDGGTKDWKEVELEPSISGCFMPE